MQISIGIVPFIYLLTSSFLFVSCLFKHVKNDFLAHTYQKGYGEMISIFIFNHRISSSSYEYKIVFVKMYIISQHKIFWCEFKFSLTVKTKEWPYTNKLAIPCCLRESNAILEHTPVHVVLKSSLSLLCPNYLYLTCERSKILHAFYWHYSCAVPI